MKLKLATKKQIKEICDLINLAYRGEEGWSRETDMLDGARTKESEIESAILNPDSHLLVYTQDNKVASCICIEKDGDNAHIGLFAVHPRLQGKGIGKRLLSLSEEFASKNLGSKKYVVMVLSQRRELISYYERRGYVRTGKIEDYPKHPNGGIPKIMGLTFEYLEKST